MHLVTEARLLQLRRRLSEEESQAALISSQPNRFYLSGFTGSDGFLLVTQEAAFLIADSRYTAQAAEQAPEFEVLELKRNFGSLLGEALSTARPRSGKGQLLFEANRVTVSALSRWQSMLAEHDPDWEWVQSDDLVERLRLIKDAAEIEQIRSAMRLADDSFISLLPEIRPGIQERDLALELEWRMRKAGATGVSFDFIVASGPRSALPHGIAGTRRLEIGDFVTFDFGCIWNGYCSDITRTVVLGSANTRQREVYETVRTAQAAGLAAITAGMSCAETDQRARQVIEEAGYGDYFGHGLGHGVGIEVHEGPRLATSGDETLQAGMVVTVEPGIYLPGWGGVRIEDTVIVLEEGHENLTHSSKQLIEL